MLLNRAPSATPAAAPRRPLAAPAMGGGPPGELARRRAGALLVLALALALVCAVAILAAPGPPRNCGAPWPTLDGAPRGAVRIALVTLAAPSSRASEAAAAAAVAAAGGPAPPRFDELLRLTRANKARYAAAHGYAFIDASDALDASRPASWSKIRAVKRHLGSYDWVFWLDADTVITNPTFRLEALLPAAGGGDRSDSSGGGGGGPDLLITRDAGGYNAGG